MTEAELLFTQILGCRRLDLYLNRNSLFKKDKAADASEILKRRIKSEPLPYILGKVEFMGLEFRVTPEVFIPRMETEILVETTLEKVTSLKSQVTSILEIGTGSGCIAVSLAKFLPQVEITATDISAEALRIAQENALMHKVAEKITFLQSNLFSSCDLRLKTYDLIVSNPPYIPSKEIEYLEPEIQYEPLIALDGGKDGLDFYRRIAKSAPRYLRKGGLMLWEMGMARQQDIEHILPEEGDFRVRERVKDYLGIERVMVLEYG